MNSNLRPFGFAVALLLAVSGNAMGQTSTTETHWFPYSATNSEIIVGRVASDGSHIITFYYDYSDTSKRFVWDDPATSIGSYFELDSNFSIQDFERIDDKVFFCGRYDTSGVVGYFSESLFSLWPANVTYSVIPETAILTKMDVYLDHHTSHYVVAAVGEDRRNYPTEESGLFIFDFYASSVSYYYNELNPRIFQDVAVTDNCIVTTGVFNVTSNLLALTVVDKSDLSQFLPFTPNETAGEMSSWNYSVTHLKDDKVAISTLVFDTPSPTYYSIPVHVFDASAKAFVNSQKFYVIEKTSARNEMRYFREYSTLLLLHNNYYPTLNNINSVIYYLDPFNTLPYSALLTYNANYYYYSLDRYPGSHFLATGKEKTKCHSFMIHDSQSQPKFNCLQSDNENVYIITRPKKNDLNKLGFYQNTVPLLTFSPTLQIIHSNRDCIQK